MGEDATVAHSGDPRRERGHHRRPEQAAARQGHVRNPPNHSLAAAAAAATAAAVARGKWTCADPRNPARCCQQD